ncbi:YggS family pyridoxal phosphate-dependent enzyme [Thermophilibacter provencensis]|uniref:Pyridoxal phosphate homeostasis protein n=1 Tax=Thermophilibacter provencensis TaxID=1852386 RepID=A0ABT7V440_9ACTN|nr:YggS family pyridoxal phosphate-dependent enzyme [Thermophilibacter provencensis]MDM8271367.1 YggS family pyridoxal phosphate-dependent enzyme [Thermophilibacter provencensis]
MSEDEQYARFLRERREEILERVAAAAGRAGRSAGDVRAIAVSKTVGPREVLLARGAGWDAFGENRPQELGRKLEALGQLPEMAGVRFDMIGNLQKNKINQVIGRVTLIHSISSEHLAEAVSVRSEARGICSDVLLEVNVSGEASKSGFAPDELRAAVERVVALPGLCVRGLMTMAPVGDADAARRTFSGLRELAEELRGRTGLALETNSCGMSDDFEIAVEEGSTLVRLGRCVFDQGYALT